MNYLDLYLQRNNCKRYDVYKTTGISQQLLSTHKNKKVEKYSNKVIIALANTLGKTPGAVLDELIELEKSNPAFEVYNPDELLLALDNKYEKIMIKGAYCDKIYSLMKSQLSDTESLGFELGSSGTATVLAYAITAVREFFSNSDSVDRGIQNKIKLYKLNDFIDGGLLLTLKQLDY